MKKTLKIIAILWLAISFIIAILNSMNNHNRRYNGHFMSDVEDMIMR